MHTHNFILSQECILVKIMHFFEITQSLYYLHIYSREKAVYVYVKTGEYISISTLFKICLTRIRPTKKTNGSMARDILYMKSYHIVKLNKSYQINKMNGILIHTIWMNLKNVKTQYESIGMKFQNRLNQQIVSKSIPMATSVCG